MNTMPPEFYEQFFGDAFSIFVAVFAIAFVFILINLVLHAIIAIWIVKDAKNRGMDEVLIWGVVGFVAGIIGLIIYILTRPAGKLVSCKNCKRWKLETLPMCPHCGG